MEVLPAPLWRVAFPNGHHVLAHVPGRLLEAKSPRLPAGTRVVVEMSPYDLSQGRIRLDTDRNELP